MLLRAIEDTQEGDKKDAFDVALDGALKGGFASAIEDTIYDLSEGTPIGVPRDLCKDVEEGAFEIEIKVRLR